MWKETDLVIRDDQGADQTSDDHDLVDEDCVEYSGPWHAGGQEQVHEQERGGDDPVGG